MIFSTLCNGIAYCISLSDATYQYYHLDHYQHVLEQEALKKVNKDLVTAASFAINVNQWYNGQVKEIPLNGFLYMASSSKSLGVVIKWHF